MTTKQNPSISSAISNPNNDNVSKPKELDFPLSPLYRRISDIKIGKRARKSLGDMDSLVESIMKGGLIQNIVIDKSNKLIVGRRRLEACKILGWKTVPVTIRESKDPLSDELDENIVREPFKFSERMGLLEKIERQRIGHRTGKGDKLTPFQKDEKGKKSRDIVSEYTGVSQGQLSKEKRLWQIIKENPKFELLIEKIDNNEISVHNALEIVQESINNNKPVDGLISNTEKFKAYAKFFFKQEEYRYRSAEERCISMFEYNFIADDLLLEFLVRLGFVKENMLNALTEIKPELLTKEKDRRTILAWIVRVEELDKWLKHWGEIQKGPDRSSIFRPNGKFDKKSYYGSEQHRIEYEAVVNICYKIGYSEFGDGFFKVYIKEFGDKEISNINRKPILEYEQLTKEQLDAQWSSILERRMTLIRGDIVISANYDEVQLFIPDNAYHDWNMETFKIDGGNEYLFPLRPPIRYIVE